MIQHTCSPSLCVFCSLCLVQLPVCSCRSHSSACSSRPVSPSRRMRTPSHSVRQSFPSHHYSPRYSASWHSSFRHRMPWSSSRPTPVDPLMFCLLLTEITPTPAPSSMASHHHSTKERVDRVKSPHRSPVSSGWSRLESGYSERDFGSSRWTWGSPSVSHTPSSQVWSSRSQVQALDRTSSHSPSCREGDLQNISRNTPLLVLLRLCHGSSSYVVILLLLLKATKCMAFT